MFQEPDRITKDLVTDIYAPGNRSLSRALDELAECECLNEIHVSQIVRVYHTASLMAFEDYLEGEVGKAPRDPNDVFGFWDYETIIDIDAFLGLTVVFEGSAGATRIAEGNPAAQRIRDEVEKQLEFFFPHPVYLRPDADGQSLG